MRRLFLHIGLHKTGTTYLQNVLRANRANLAAQGVFFPGGQDTQVAQMLAVWDLLGRRRRRGDRDNRITGQWSRLTTGVAEDLHPVTLLSEEHFSLATVAQARRVIASFPDRQVHVVVTVRDLGRVVVSSWQEEVKHNQSWTWEAYVAAVRDPKRRSVTPARGFWLRQDLPAILTTWAAAVPPARIHVVTVPPPGSSPHQLLERFASVVGIQEGLLTNEPKWDNQTAGVAGTEVVRRLNELLDSRLNERQYNRVVNATLVRALSRSGGSTRLGLPASELEWVRSWARQAVEHVQEAGYHVVGDLSELIPMERPDLRRPDDSTADEQLDAAMTALAAVSDAYARAWWSQKPSDEAVEKVSPPARLASTARGVLFRGRRRAADLADRHPALGRLMAYYLALRARRARSVRGRP